MSLTSYRAAPPRDNPDRNKKARTKRAISKNIAYHHCKNSDFGWPGNDLLSQSLSFSTIGAAAFNGRVRDGIGFCHDARATRPAKIRKQAYLGQCPTSGPFLSHPMSTRTLAMRAFKPIEELVLVSSTRHRAYTPSLSTWSSSTPLKGALVLRWVSRLDAFSGYPVHT